MPRRGFVFGVFVLLLWAPAVRVSAQDADAFSPVRDYLERSVESGAVAGGAVIVCHRGEVVLRTGFGYADLKSKKPFEADTPVVIASISKPVLGTALYRLVDAGKLDVSRPITEYLPEFAGRKLESGDPIGRAPTVMELLTHTSGLRNDSAPGGRVWYQSWSRDQTLEFVVGKIAREFPFKARPGTRFAYSGIGTEVAARVGEIVSGLPRNEMLTTHLCEPLGMTNTFYLDVEGVKRLKRPFPTRYHRDKESGKLKVSRKRHIPPRNRYSSSGGTVVSTAPDLLKWLRMIRDGGKHEGRVFLKPGSRAELLRGKRVGRTAAGGLFVRAADAEGRPTRYGHTGSSGTNVWMDLESDTIGIMLTQTKGSDIKPFRIELERRVDAAVVQLK